MSWVEVSDFFCLAGWLAGWVGWQHRHDVGAVFGFLYPYLCCIFAVLCTCCWLFGWLVCLVCLFDGLICLICFAVRITLHLCVFFFVCVRLSFACSLLCLFAPARFSLYVVSLLFDRWMFFGSDENYHWCKFLPSSCVPTVWALFCVDTLFSLHFVAASFCLFVLFDSRRCFDLCVCVSWLLANWVCICFFIVAYVVLLFGRGPTYLLLGLSFFEQNTWYGPCLCFLRPSLSFARPVKPKPSSFSQDRQRITFINPGLTWVTRQVTRLTHIGSELARWGPKLWLIRTQKLRTPVGERSCQVPAKWRAPHFWAFGCLDQQGNCAVHLFFFHGSILRVCSSSGLFPHLEPIP